MVFCVRGSVAGITLYRRAGSVFLSVLTATSKLLPLFSPLYCFLMGCTADFFASSWFCLAGSFLERFFEFFLELFHELFHELLLELVLDLLLELLFELFLELLVELLLEILLELLLRNSVFVAPGCNPFLRR